MKFSLDILFVLLKDFLVAQGETEMAEKISSLLETDEKDLLDIRKKVKFTDILKCFFKRNPELKMLINSKSEEILEKLTKKDEEPVEEESDTEEDPEEEEKTPPKKVNVSNGKANNKKKSKKEEVVVYEEPKVEETVKETPLLGNKTERKPFQRIDDSVKEKLPEELKNNSYDHFSKVRGDEFGKPANDKLKHNKGRDFRKEKTKFKNKMSFGGQRLSTEVRSIRLDEDE